MLQRIPDAFRSYPLVHQFVFNRVRMQFEDIGAMLRLPMKAEGIKNGCNFAIASVICNLISGISVTIFQPTVWQRRTKKGGIDVIGSGEAFKEFVKEFYPDPTAHRRSEIADVLYKFLRNPFAHALGVFSKSASQRPVRPFLRRFRRNGPQPCIEFWRKAQQRQNPLLQRAQSGHISSS
jgi:hypothetical protein